MNNKYHPKIISEIITLKVVTVTREAFVLHKILFCDHRKLFGRSRASPNISVLPHLCQVMVMCQQNIKTYTTQECNLFIQVFPNSFLWTFLPSHLYFSRENAHESSWPTFLLSQEVSLLSTMNSSHWCFLSCPVLSWSESFSIHEPSISLSSIYLSTVFFTSDFYTNVQVS